MQECTVLWGISMSKTSKDQRTGWLYSYLIPLPVPERVLSQFSGYRTMTWQNGYGKYSGQQGDAISGEYLNTLRHYWQQKALKTCSRDRTFTYYVYEGFNLKFSTK